MGDPGALQDERPSTHLLCTLCPLQKHHTAVAVLAPKNLNNLPLASNASCWTWKLKMVMFSHVVETRSICHIFAKLRARHM
jgi:hypothetical protein